MLTFKPEIRDSEIAPHDERRMVWPQNTVALLGRPVEVIITPLGTNGAGFELTKAFFLFRVTKTLSGDLDSSLHNSNHHVLKAQVI
jgi:hypothetical protein